MSYFIGIIACVGMAVSLFFFTFSFSDLILLLPLFEKIRPIPRIEYLKLLYGSPKLCCIFTFVLSAFYLFLFKFAYPYFCSLS